MVRPLGLPFDPIERAGETWEQRFGPAAAMRAATSVFRVQQILLSRFDEALRPHGLTSGQFSLLMSLNRPEPPNMGSVASLLAMDRTTLTAALKPLERRGLVSVAVDAADRRGRRLTLTATGRSALASAVPAWERTHAAVEGLVGPSDPDALREGLRALS
jgi:DNA-binding MarR family transcriptional regulator